MSARRVLGVGSPLRGDDGVGPAVLEALKEDPPTGVELHPQVDPGELPALVSGASEVVLVDAFVGAGATPGEVRVLDAAALERAEAAGAVRVVSTHGMSVSQGLALARVLDPEGVAPRIMVVGVAVSREQPHRDGLSPPVAAAVPRAAAAVRELLEESKEAEDA